MFGGGILFSVIPVIVTLGFVVVFGIIIVMAVRGIAQWNRNNNSPVLCVFATIVAKRANTSHHHHQHTDNMAMSHSSSSTSYYVTFEVDSGDRMELHMNGEQYGLLIEGDKGNLTFQGTRYLGFERQK